MLSTNLLWRDQFLLQEILPPANLYKPQPEEKLNAVEIIYRLALSSLANFCEKKLSSFDCIVGDQLCEIRVFQVILLSRENMQGELEWSKKMCLEKVEQIAAARFLLKENAAAMKRAVSEEKEKMEGYKARNKEICRFLFPKPAPDQDIPKLEAEFKGIKKEQEAIQKAIKVIEQDHLKRADEIVSDSKLETLVSGKIKMLIVAHLLTKIKKEETVFKPSGGCFINDKTLVTGLKAVEIKCPTALFEKSIPSVKKWMMKLSADFMQQQTLLLNPENEVLSAMLSKRRNIQKKNQEEIPFYYALRALYLRAVQEKIPVVLKIRNFDAHPLSSASFVCKALFKPEEGNGLPRYELAEVSGEDSAQPAIIVEAFSSSKQEVLKQSGFLKGILQESGGLLNYLTEFDAVQHAQYTDQEESSDAMFDAIPDLPKDERLRLVQLKNIASNKGFSQLNCFQCCVEHVFADLIGNQLIEKSGDER